MSPVAAIVDPYSTGVLIAPALRRRGYRTVCVQSSSDLAKSLLRTYRAADFDEHLLFDGDLQSLTDRLRRLAPAFVLPGNESAVELADLLSHALGTRGNVFELSAARRNKYLMIERIAAAGLYTARQTTVASAAQAVAWAEETGWPVVAKPLDSASTDNVSVCSDAEALTRAVGQILSSVNFCGRRNEMALLQTYLDGEEYVVNTVSRDGRHYVCDVLHSKKRTLNGSPFVYDYYRLLPADGELQRDLVSYILKALDALGIRNGASHAEIRMTSRGPALVEVAARAMGPLGSTTAMAAGTGHDQVDLLVDAFDGGKEIEQRCGKDYPFLQHAMCLYLATTVSGRVSAMADCGLLDRLESVRGYQFLPRVGDVLRPTQDLTSVLAKIYMAHPDPEVLEADYRAIRAAEGELQPVVERESGSGRRPAA